MEPQELAALLKSPDRERTLVLDVRDDDFVGGHIKGCVNLTSDHFDDDAEVDAIIKEHCVNKDRVVVHCMMSQRRGPACAARLADRVLASDLDPKPTVFVLTSGFQKFGQLYSHDPDLCEAC
eukprot:evm.model.scf_1866.4 EVM.evm.TU.scf_1866.4   scf_1866:25197-26091(-)